MAEATPSSPLSREGGSTAVALPERVPALLRIYDDVLKHAARILHNTVKRWRGRKPSLERCREMVQRNVIWDPKNPGVPLVGSVAFAPEKYVLCYGLGQKLNGRGEPMVKADGSPVPWLYPIEGRQICYEMELPDTSGEMRRHRVIALISCNGCGDLIPYAYKDEQDELRGVPAMRCIFVRDFDPKSGDAKPGRVKALPLGLGDRDHIDQWNAVVTRRASQDPTKAWERIEPISHALGMLGQYLELQPQGPVETGGELEAWKDAIEPDYTKPDYRLVAPLGGKLALLDDSKSPPIIIRDGAVPAQLFRFEEDWNAVRLTVWGLPDEVGDLAGMGQSIDLGAVRVDALALLGATLYDVNPRSGPSLLRQALQRPPVERMIAWGLIPPGASHETAVSTLRAMTVMLREQIATTVTETFERMVNTLGVGGTEYPGINLADALGSTRENPIEPTSELLAQAHDNPPTQDNLLVVAILASKVAGELGLSVWDPWCWILQMTYKALLLQLAAQAGIELPPPPVVEEKPADPPAAAATTEPPTTDEVKPADAADSGSPPNGSAAPAIVWREDMGRDELYELAKTLEGVNSRATKAKLVAALQAVCPPTPPA